MAKDLNVCLISSDFFPVWSGIGTYLISLVRNLPNNVRIHVVTVKRENMGNSQNKNDPYKSPFFAELAKRADIHFISQAKGTFFYHYNFQSACRKFVPQLCKDFEIDLIHSNFPLMSDIQVKVLRKLRTPSVTTAHSTIEGQHLGVRRADMELSHLQMSDKANLLLYYPLKIFELIYVSKTRHFIAVSESIKKELVKHLKVNENRIETIHNGVDVKRFNPDYYSDSRPAYFPSNRPVVLFTGRFVATKGINVLIKAIPKIIKSNPEAFFLFVGGGDYSPYQSFLNAHGINNRSFLFKGYVDESEIPKVYSHSSIYVAPSTYEPLGIRILEAMSCNLPVIASDVGGISEIIDNDKNGLLIPPNDHEALAEKIIQLLEDEGLSNSLGLSARRNVVQRFSDKRMSEKTFDFYNHILNFN